MNSLMISCYLETGTRQRKLLRISWARKLCVWRSSSLEVYYLEVTQFASLLPTMFVDAESPKMTRTQEAVGKGRDGLWVDVELPYPDCKVAEIATVNGWCLSQLG